MKLIFRKKILLISFGFLFFFLLLEAGLRLGGWAFLSLQEYRNKESLRKTGIYRIICLGESTTAIGGENSYPRQLEDILNKKDLNIRFSVINKGVPSINTSGIIKKLKGNIDRYNPDMIIVMMGINDDYKNISYPFDSLEEPSQSMLALISSNFRVWELFRLMRLHILSKIKEVRPKLDKEGTNPIKETTDLDSNKEEEYFQQGLVFEENEDYQEALNCFQKAIRIDPNNADGYFRLGRVYDSLGKSTLAQKMFKQAIDINPNIGGYYLGLGSSYAEAGNFQLAEDIFKKGLEINPLSGDIYRELGKAGIDQYKSREEGLGLIEKSFELEPDNYKTCIVLGHYYMGFDEDSSKIINVLNKAIELSPNRMVAYRFLGKFYQSRGAYDKAKDIYQAVRKIKDKSPEVYSYLALYSLENNRYALACNYFDKAAKLRSRYFQPVTIDNYGALYKIVRDNNIKLVIISYPCRSIESIKRFMRDAGDILFIDNEKVFKNALKNADYDEYFRDAFAGDFGHCTDKGNYLLADNVADNLISNYFKHIVDNIK